MGLEILPGKLLQELFAEADLLRTGQVHRFVPGDDAVGAAVRRFAMISSSKTVASGGAAAPPGAAGLVP